MQLTNPYSASRIMPEPRTPVAERLAPIQPADAWKEKPEERKQRQRTKSKQNEDNTTVELDGDNPHLDIKV